MECDTQPQTAYVHVDCHVHRFASLWERLKGRGQLDLALTIQEDPQNTHFSVIIGDHVGSIVLIRDSQLRALRCVEW
jgi:hypothetical protein